MRELLGDLLVRAVPVLLPAVLICSFLMNHNLMPSGGSKKDSGDKPSKKSKSEESSDSTEG